MKKRFFFFAVILLVCSIAVNAEIFRFDTGRGVLIDGNRTPMTATLAYDPSECLILATLNGRTILEDNASDIRVSEDGIIYFVNNFGQICASIFVDANNDYGFIGVLNQSGQLNGIEFQSVTPTLRNSFNKMKTLILKERY